MNSLSLFLSWYVHLFLSSDIRDPGSRAIGFQDLHQWPLVLVPLASDLEIHHEFHWISALASLNYGMSFASSQAYRQQTVGLLDVCNHTSPSP